MAGHTRTGDFGTSAADIQRRLQQAGAQAQNPPPAALAPAPAPAPVPDFTSGPREGQFFEPTPVPAPAVNISGVAQTGRAATDILGPGGLVPEGPQPTVPVQVPAQAPGQPTQAAQELQPMFDQGGQLPAPLETQRDILNASFPPELQEFIRQISQQGLETLPQVGPNREFTPRFEPSQQISDLSTQLADFFSQQAGPTQEALQTRGGQFQQANEQQRQVLEQLFGQGQGALSEQQARLQQAGGQVPGLFQQAQGQAGAFGQRVSGAEQFQADRTPTFQTAVEGALQGAQGLPQLAQQQTQQLIQSTTDQIDRQFDDDLQSLRDELGAANLLGGGAEREAILDLRQRTNRDKTFQIAQITNQANQQQFQNLLSAQQNIAGIGGAGQALRAGRQGEALQQSQAVQQAQANRLGFSQAGGDIGLRALQAGTGFGQQQLGNVGAFGQRQQGLAGSIGDLLRGGAETQFQTGQQVRQAPADFLQAQQGQLLSEEARQAAFNQANFARDVTQENLLQQFLNQVSGQASTGTQAATSAGGDIARLLQAQSTQRGAGRNQLVSGLINLLSQGIQTGIRGGGGGGGGGGTGFEFDGGGGFFPESQPFDQTVQQAEEQFFPSNALFE